MMGDVIEGAKSAFNQTGLGQVVGGLFGDGGTGDAVAAQRQGKDGANAMLAEQQRYQAQQFQPYADLRGSTLSQLQNPNFQKDFSMADFQKDPGYDFRLQEGMKAINASGAARGMANSGATLKALTRYGQDYASNEFQKSYDRFNQNADRRFGRLKDLTGISQYGTDGLVNSSQNFGNKASDNIMGFGNAQASAAIANGNRQANTAGQILQLGTAAFSDARLKKNVREIDPADLQELRQTIRPYAFEYVSDEYGRGEWVGAMAQDLMKSKLGRTAVHQDESGNLKVDLKKVGSFFLATLAEVA